jgi:hypothetical protein
MNIHIPLATLVLFITTIIFMCCQNYNVGLILAILTVAASLQETRKNSK